ncbi:MAG: ATP-binding cassette domain-containing protein [Lachnospiraceae bacterium]|uniref:ATP-binding cassette domain-containing protein n=1 Tax=Roseburia hominis TaxID=301301 RepID=UPI001F304BA5|nr:ABC transporter ATP-binding protein [Roseburia hominis]MDY4838847.1 ATP-binding cassette domain-containing protein [Lachnospiraceae bacterium]
MNDIISLNHISKSYQGQSVFSDLCLSIPKGEFTAITAPSGYGKTTLLRLLMELEKPDGGTITGLTGQKKSAVFQEDRLCENLSSLTNIRLTASKSDETHILTAMEQIGLYDCAKKKVSELSGGMKRRVAILRALLADYDILFLDEPFKGLDKDTKDLVIKYTGQHITGKTVIFTTHVHSEISALHVKNTISLPELSGH